jgi:tRNA pseudouridine32 synthase/23S rRNA pseudouridine746 synthase
MPLQSDKFIRFKTNVQSIEIPTKFNFPFYYTPHSLCKIAANELQEYLTIQNDWEHNFGLDSTTPGLGIGKMFGILIVENTEKEIGYLAAFSGKLASENHHPIFVPPIYDTLDQNGFYKKGEAILNIMNKEIKNLENQPIIEELNRNIQMHVLETNEYVESLKKTIRQNKKIRALKRNHSTLLLNEEETKNTFHQLAQESINEQYHIKKYIQQRNNELLNLRKHLDTYLDAINELKEARKSKSSFLQKKLHESYSFLNAKGITKDLCSIFEATTQLKPPAGAGECAAPKLLHYAYANKLHPIAMCEFWWGESPKSEIRVHKEFYPACRGKCEPILGHMLIGLEVEKNPMLINHGINKEITIVYEDDDLVVINKPEEFLSVPGKNIEDSVYSRMKLKYPNATGPLIVHRLDMSTSGLMLIAKNKEVHKHLQYQFLKKTIKKRYEAILDGIITSEKGTIELPLRVDLDNRPMQLVCYEFGKSAKTEWEIVSSNNGRTKVYFYPITGRTHQLRVHAAHQLGLKTPIVGDDLYGKRSDRLYLHAGKIEFKHPVTKEILTIELPADF